MVGSLEIGAVSFNPDGWGPPDATASSASNLPANVPYAPFSRSDKLGRIADWTRNFNNPTRIKNPADAAFDFTIDDSFPASADDDASFRLVDGKPPPRPRFGPKWRFQQQRQLPQRRDEEVEARKREAEKERARRDRLYHLNRSNANNTRREAAVFKSSVDIQPEWNMLDQIPFSTFSKLSFAVPEPEDLLLCGGLEYYDRSYDRITPKNERRLERFKNRNFFKVTTTDDPVIRRLANEDKATVFATDTILSSLMCAPRSVYSWDIVIQRVGNKLFFDKRDGSQLDLLSVHETSQEPLPEAKEDINSAHSLSVEAAYINQNFSQQVLIRDGNKVAFDEPNPFANDGEEVASVAYRYRRWKLDDDMYLVARCEVQSVVDMNNQRSFLTLNALNEFDPKYSGVEWRQKLETQRGAVLATELKNNANKLAKWTAQALLASADMMKLGYVSRVHPRDHFNHVILAVNGYKPRDFATQINLNTSNMWGIVKSIVDLCMKLNEGKYVLVKDPSKPQVRIYEVPVDAFENDYVEEPLPEEEQVQPPTEGGDGGEATTTTNDVEDKQIGGQA
ncbi:eukaryotic translation initiation factor 3 subunit D-like [Neltuma alba]|uniref:eukaryotic translation initiation factor 3 subunit D-like n=1 Tax=Neltuma alba TaxID=207710 RepID=UPI0010A3A049|nr:eukaryotic translation initiation factor 3 subunit D-like [Prosopis alba]XP_028767048.1 eukaryotic translation initiation factor 3 subunit D-like [Prosopis alba]XP_028767049.1 eukaryotic translation initiation factor 3 subunit D-like [Prosopis alba]XP_028767050.1 eukaryotic translation initiation factor 3 subunit D-like [Prosopis alba]XP_028787588.1 eukaryotic translation initiation factor 3 subunit D-like [Prosopis alba]XP_028787589.1 eukaryotic translation initiation factor 3 subunit D-li